MVQISAGRGPKEVVKVVAELARLLPQHLKRRGATVGPLTWGVGRRSVVFEVDGIDLRIWLGTHERVDPVRGKGRRKRWFVDVRALRTDEPPDPFDSSKITFFTARSGGPGGQHVNTTSSAVRAVYEPTGWQVRVTSERSQRRNRKEAIRRLRALHTQECASWRGKLVGRLQHAHDDLLRGGPAVTWVDGPDGWEPMAVYPRNDLRPIP